jgi:hypothetical protein
MIWTLWKKLKYYLRFSGNKSIKQYLAKNAMVVDYLTIFVSKKLQSVISKDDLPVALIRKWRYFQNIELKIFICILLIS